MPDMAPLTFWHGALIGKMFGLAWGMLLGAVLLAAGIKRRRRRATGEDQHPRSASEEEAEAP
jgi:hypothetical protein